MKTKYQHEISLIGFADKPIKFSGQSNSLDELRFDLGSYQHSSHFRSKGTQNFKKYFVEIRQAGEVLNLTKKLAAKNRSIVIKTKAVQFDDAYQGTLLVEAFHTALRKYCNSKASWGLWQNINYACDQKQTVGLEVFWTNLAYTWREVLKKYSFNQINSLTKEEQIKLAQDFKTHHMEEMTLDEKINGQVLYDNSELRALWFMLLGLYDALPSEELYACLSALADAKIE